MAKNIEPKLVTIGSYLSLEEDAMFLIPEYQRKYAWEVQNCDKLWSDIKDFIENQNKDPYFFGTIIINCSNEDTELGLIDGQQRTTTFMLLLKALLTRINETLKNMVDDSESELLKRGLRERRRKLISILYKMDLDEITDEPDEEKDKEIYSRFSNLINNSNQETYKEELINIMKSSTYEEAEKSAIKIPYKQKDNRYTNFFKNYKHFYFKEDLNKIDFLNKFTRTILEECQVIEIKSWKVEQAITMFNSLNSDGMPLTDSDIIYSKMFAATQDDNERKLLGKKWKYLIELTNELEIEKVTNLNGLLNQKMYLYRSLDGKTINASGNIDVTTPGLRRYYTDINTSLLKKPIEFCNELIKLAEIWNIAKENNTMKVLFNFNDNSKLFIASYFYRYESYFVMDDNGKFVISKDNKNDLIEKIEKIAELMLRLFAILSLVDAGYSSSNFKSFLFKEEIKLADASIHFEEIEKDFEEHINKCWQKDNIITRLKDYEKNDIVYLNEYLFAKETRKEFEFGSNIDIEHIMPQSGKNIRLIQNDAGIENDEEFSNYINKIGNKILLEYNINRTIGNEWFRTKISTKISEKSGYINSIFPLAQYLVEKYKNEQKPYWTKNDIDTATSDASKRILNFIFDGITNNSNAEVENQSI